MGRVLAISSLVARGNVGLAATVPALQGLGHEVWAVPTVLLASRPGLGSLVKFAVPVAELAGLLAGLHHDGGAGLLNAVFTGYFPSALAVATAAAAIRRLKEVNAELIVLVDPVLGDADRLYVAAETAAAIRDELLPLADVTTPNLFELAWLVGCAPVEIKDVPAAARRLRLPTVVVTSAASSKQAVCSTLVTAGEAVDCPLQRREGIPNGAGDVFAGLLLGRWLNDGAGARAFRRALADLEPVLAASQHQPVLDLGALPRRIG
jgi:pyridoxine kinase